jgi:hypothetical protein
MSSKLFLLKNLKNSQILNLKYFTINKIPIFNLSLLRNKNFFNNHSNLKR